MHLFTLFLLTAATFAQLQEPLAQSSNRKDVLTPEIDNFIENVLKSWNSPAGVGVAVVQKNEDGTWNIEKKGYGVAKADGSKVTEDTLFAIGSNSKLFDVIATGLLISNESLSPQISWNTKISSIIPEWEMADPIATSESTIIDLMSHRTGLPRHDMVYNDSEPVGSLISQIKYLRPSAGFRETWQYNNIMYIVLSYIPEVFLNVRFAQYVKKHIFLPLGLHATTYSGDLAGATGKLAAGFARDQVNKTEDIFGMGIPRALPYWNPGGEEGNIISGAGGVISSARDMMAANASPLGKKSDNQRPSDPESVITKVATGVTVLMGSPPAPEIGPVVYGGGQMASTYRGHNGIQHGGATPGFHSQVVRFPLENFGVAVLTNDDAYGEQYMEVIKWRIIDEILGLEPIDWDSRLKHEVTEGYQQSLENITPRPAEPDLPSVSFASLSGRYVHPAYGTFDLCGLPSTDSKPNAACKELIDEIPTRLPGVINASLPTFIVHTKKTWLTHIRLEHFSGNLFNVSGFGSLVSIYTFIAANTDVTVGLA
ncbi:beta-lactamase/transpeptidase-like protein [Rhodocollybia butyracea]|uniref:Beta-lactamase/transpeptidase-like protein n=2 Tax=Rhodocollybia butyracea TaxID=206335 RepID=A0A9P5U9B2_9AGAR|nr:beta-lactamase/transpeptidase-like protein [Rhodocollybia butyracea]